MIPSWCSTGLPGTASNTSLIVHFISRDYPSPQLCTLSLMGYSGAVPSEDSSGKRKQRGSITKTGNAHLRRIVVEAAWSYRHRPAIGPRLRKRQEGVPEPIKEIALKAQVRLSKRYARLAAAGKDQRKIITAVGREVVGFIWAIGVKVEAASKQPMAS